MGGAVGGAMGGGMPMRASDIGMSSSPGHMGGGGGARPLYTQTTTHAAPPR